MISQRRIRIAALVILANAAVALQFLPSAQACVDECEKPKFLCKPLNACLQMSLAEKYAECHAARRPSCFTKCAFDCVASAPSGACKLGNALQCNYKSSQPAPCPAPPCGAGLTLQNQTEATIPLNRARTNVGVGERVTLSLVPAPACPVSWQVISGIGSLDAASGASVTLTVHDRTSTSKVRATVNGIVYDTPQFDVVQPTHETGVKHHDLTDFLAGQVGSGMFVEVKLQPTDVSFEEVEIRELGGPATNRLGYFVSPLTAPITHDPPAEFAPIFPGNLGSDTVRFALPLPHPTPLAPGSFEFVIPVRWQVINGPSGEATTLPNQLQSHAITNANGTSTATKFCTPGPCASVTRTP